VLLESVELMNRNLLVSARTPYISVKSALINITEEYANGEIGFENNAIITIKEPEVEPHTLALQLQRKGTLQWAVL